MSKQETASVLGQEVTRNGQVYKTVLARIDEECRPMVQTIDGQEYFTLSTPIDPKELVMKGVDGKDDWTKKVVCKGLGWVGKKPKWEKMVFGSHGEVEVLFVVRRPYSNEVSCDII